MFLKVIKRQGEEIFRLEKINKQMNEMVEEARTEKEQLKVYFNDITENIIIALNNIQSVNQMQISQYEKNKRVNALIFNLNKLLLNAKFDD